LLALLCALALPAPASSFAKRGPGYKVGVYKGKTSQGLPITARVSRTGAIFVEFDWRARCADGRRHRNGIAVGGRVSRRSFSIGGTLNTGGKVRVKGKLRGRVAWGHLSRWGPSAFGTFNCPARGVRWKARFKPASGDQQPAFTSFRGTTSQGLPIGFHVTPTQVVSLSFDWTAFCADGQHHSNSIFGGDAPLNQGNFSMGGTLNTGGTFQVDGVVNGTTAAGTLSRSGPSAFGTFDCTASGVTWQAQALNTRR